MQKPFTQIMLFTLGYALVNREVRRYCERATEKHKAADLQVQTCEDEGGKPASTPAGSWS